MKKGLFIFTIGALVLTGCSSNEGFSGPRDSVADNVKNRFGVTFDPNHDWCTTTSGTVTISGIPAGATNVQLFALISKEVKNDDNETEAETSLLKLNEATNVGSSVNLVYDAPKDHQAIYAAADVNGYRMMRLVKNGVADFSGTKSAAARRRAAVAPDYSSMKLFADSTFESFASQRGWFGEKKQYLYGMSGEAYQKWVQKAEPYSAEYTQLFRDLVFSYFQNKVRNLEKIMESKLVNDKVYPLTTGDAPIVVSPVYKCDQATRWGNEVWNSDLYYYYYKEETLTDYVTKGGNAVDFLNALPKYKAIPFNQHFGSTEDDKIDKRFSYTLTYWGDGEPDYDRVGQAFPAGYKIGFMVRANTELSPKKKGECYLDGRLNDVINTDKSQNFWNSRLNRNDPRAAWLNLNDHLLLCWESGTDADFNDIILEVNGLGGITPPPPVYPQVYTFCFEDTKEKGDYDMNDVVIRAIRKNETTVQYSIIACGAHDELTVCNINSAPIFDDKEIHSLFGKQPSEFINTQNGAEYIKPVIATVTVDPSFSFLDKETQPYIHDITTGIDVHVAEKGQNPYGILIPNTFLYPIERTCIKDAYSQFNKWGENAITSTLWYLNSAAASSRVYNN